MNISTLSKRGFTTEKSSSSRTVSWLRVVPITLLALLGNYVQAADITWDGGTSGANNAWLTPEHWAGDVAPSATDNAQFGSLGSAGIIGINMNGTVNNGLNNHAVGSITLLASSTIDRTVRNSSTSVGGTLTLNGVGGTLLANASSDRTLTIANGPSQTMNLALNSSGAISVNSGAQIVINSIISETAGGSKGFTKTGGGTLTLGAVNTYSGGTTLSQGSINLGVNDSLGTGGLNFAGGILNANNRTDSTIGALTLGANSTLNLVSDANNGSLTFASATRTGGTLTINGWAGAPGGAGTDDRIFITAAPNQSFLDNVYFDIGGNLFFANYVSGELIAGITPVPEPINVALGVFGVLFAAVGIGRRYLARRKV